MELKLRKKYKYIIYRLNDDNTSIIIDKKVEKSDKYEDFITELPEDDCRYAVCDFEFEKSPGEGIRNKICFVVWVPDTSKVRQKMLYASSKDALRKKLAGVATEVQATDMSEVSHEAILDKARSHWSGSLMLQSLKGCKNNKIANSDICVAAMWTNKLQLAEMPPARYLKER